MTSQLENALNGLLEAPTLDTHIRACEEHPECTEPPSIVILFPRFREDSPDLQALAEFLWVQAVNYVIPLRLRQRAKEKIVESSTGGDLSHANELIQRTRRTFIDFNKKHPHRASEVGELLAYLIALRYLKGVQLASKMALKTNSNMPVHGLDGIHATFSNGMMTLYFLESKLAKSASAGSEDYAESVAGFGNHRKQYLLEYTIISDMSNLDALSPTDRDAALEYLDVYGAKKSERIERSVGVICYTDKTIYSEKLAKNEKTPPAAHESVLAARLSKEYPSIREGLSGAFQKHGIDPLACKVFFIAFPDTDALREAFYEAMNG